MDSGTITALATAVVGIGTLLGSGIAFFIRRADKRRETNEALLIEHMRKQLELKDKEIRRLKLLHQLAIEDGQAWRDQLLRHDIEPEPEHPTKPPKEEP